MNRIILMGLISLLPQLAIAIEPAPKSDPKDKPPVYQVELIVFETTALRGWTEEYWPHQVPEVPTDDAYPIQPGVVLETPLSELPETVETDSDQVTIQGIESTQLTPQSLDETEQTEKQTESTERTAKTIENRTQAQLLQPDAPNSESPLWLLNTEASKMTPVKGYHILIHQSWIQQGLPPKQAQPIYFENEPQSEYTSALSGTLKLYKTRYAHIEANFNLQRFIPKRIREKFAQHEDLTPDLLPDYWTFNLNQARKIKPGQLHYIDHPIFGILAKIKRLKPKEIPLYQQHTLAPQTTPEQK